MFVFLHSVPYGFCTYHILFDKICRALHSVGGHGFSVLDANCDEVLGSILLQKGASHGAGCEACAVNYDRVLSQKFGVHTYTWSVVIS